MHQRRILSVCPKHDTPQSQKSVLTFVPVEFDLKGRLDVAPASLTVRFDGNLRKCDIPPLESPMKLNCEVTHDARQCGDPVSGQRFKILPGTNEIGLLEGCIVLRRDVDPDFLKDVSVEQVIRGLSVGLERQEQNPEQSENESDSISRHNASDRDLQSDNTRGKQVFAQYSLAFDIRQSLPLAVDLNFDKAIKVPRRTHRPRALAVWQDRRRTRTS